MNLKKSMEKSKNIENFLMVLLLSGLPLLIGACSNNKTLKPKLLLATVNNNMTALENFDDCSAESFNVRYWSGNTILHLAADKNVDGEIVNFLVNHNADIINLVNDYQETALMRGAFFGSLKVVETLACKANIDVNAKDSEGKTALMKAASENKLDIVKCLLRNNAAINAKDAIDRNTALHYAAQMGNIDIVKHLVCRECDVEALNLMDESAKDLAEMWNNNEISNYLGKIRVNFLYLYHLVLFFIVPSESKDFTL